MSENNTNQKTQQVTAHKPKKAWYKRIWVWILAVIVLIIIASAVGDGSKDKTNTAASTSNKSNSSNVKSATTPGLNQPADDGKFEFTVTSIQCGVPNVGSDYLTKTAQGQYCLLNLSVKNIGNESQSLVSSNQYLFNAQGQKYSADDEATIDNSPNNSTWYDNINPGNSVSGAIVFDIPKGQTPVTAELHDSAWSNGVKVDLQ